jgi:branched-chain amino acid transport system ATP-binding protein
VGRTFQIAETFASLTVLENVQMALLSADRRMLLVLARAPRITGARRARAAGAGGHGRAGRSPLQRAGLRRREARRAGDGDGAWPEAAADGRAHRRHGAAGAHGADGADQRLVVERRIAVLFTEHSMDVVFAHADRVIVLARGRLIAEGRPAEIRDHPKVQEVYFGTGKTFERQARA